MSTTTYPNGQVLTSSAQTPASLTALMQTLACQMLGIDPTTDNTAYSQVRVDWPTGGQPAFAITDDVCFLRVTEEDDPFGYFRDSITNLNDESTVIENTTYTRVWRIQWTHYGPNSFDRARALKSGLFLDWTHDQLALTSLYFLTDPDALRRAPELFSGQWWERTDLSVRLNELVSESITTPRAASVEVILDTDRGQVADLNISL